MSRNKLKSSKHQPPKLWLVFGNADGGGIYRRSLINNNRHSFAEGTRNKKAEDSLLTKVAFESIAFYSYIQDRNSPQLQAFYQDLVRSNGTEDKDLYDFMDSYLQL